MLDFFIYLFASSPKVNFFGDWRFFDVCVISLEDNFAIIHHEESIHKVWKKLEIMLDDDDHFIFGNDFFDEFDHFVFEFWRDSGSRFVEEINLGFLKIESRNFQ